MDIVQTQLEKSRRELLDLGLRNSLINYRLSAARGLEVVDELPTEIYRILVKEKKAMSFLGLADPAKTSQVYSSRFVSNQLQPPPIEGWTSALSLMEKRHTDNKLQTREVQTLLPKKLLKIFYDSNTSLEEQGVNVLFLALGMLVWYEPENKYRPHRAPLLLLPVRLERSDGRESFYIRYTEQELGDNLSLIVKLQTDFGINLPSLEEDTESDTVDVEGYFRRVESVLKNYSPDWYVDPYAIALDFFSFGKFLMYQDLNEVNWPETAKPSQHPLLRWLFSNTEPPSNQHFFGSRSAVPTPAPAPALAAQQTTSLSLDQLHPILDADSSQLQAIAAVQAGKNLIIQGPPGTGKSQTITNLIAQAIADGKTVLFVTEKMAALEVVKQRLDSVGLGAPCFELHSHKATKKAVLAELGRTLNLEKPWVDQNDLTDVSLSSLAAQLDNYAVQLNSPLEPTSLTVYKAIGELLQIGRNNHTATVFPRFKLAGMKDWNDADYTRRADLIKELAATLQKIGNPADHPFYGSTRQTLLPSELTELNAAVQSNLAVLDRLKNAGAFLASNLTLPLPNDLADVGFLGEFYRQILEITRATAGLQQLDWTNPDWSLRAAELSQIVQSVADYKTLHAQYNTTIKSEGWQADLSQIRKTLVENGESVFHWFSDKYRQARTRLDSYLTQNAPGDLPSQLALIDAVAKHQGIIAFWQSHERLARHFFRDLWQGEHSDEGQLSGLLNRVQQLQQAIRNGSLPPFSLQLLATTAPQQWSVYEQAFSDLQKASEEYQAHWARIVNFLQLKSSADNSQQLNPPQDWTRVINLSHLKSGSASASASASAISYETLLLAQPFTGQQALLEKWLNSSTRLYEWVRLNGLGESCRASGLQEIYEAAFQSSDRLEDLLVAFRKSYVETLLEGAYQSRLSLQTFWRDGQDRAIKRFCELDILNLVNQRNKLALTHWQRMPQLVETKFGSGRTTVPTPSVQATRLALLRREIGKKSRHLPIRKLLVQTAPLIQQIKPVFMMSPLSIASYLQPGAITFDLVIFDEASQIRPVDALGAILRGRQVVVAGDDQQLPPTSFFEKLSLTGSAAEDEDNEEQETPAVVSKDFESILTLFKVKGDLCMLRWHYRSRHDSLIAFSNRHFYDNKLITFPSPDYGRRKSGLIYHHLPATIYDRSRTRTNQKEAQAVAQAVMNHARQHPELSLGVVTFSSAQRVAIEEQLEQYRSLDRSSEEFFRGHPTELFFIKNLENVQGDERDVVLISVGYGRDNEGKIYLNFGPLSSAGGERRLNVLVTRAKQRCEVFTNLLPSDIDLNRAKSAGMEALRDFLETAYAGSTLPPPTNHSQQPVWRSETERTLFQALTERGYEVRQPAHTIGLAVTDPGQAGQYLLGFDTDGPDYADIERTSDRERLRTQMLVGLGWKLHRVWSIELYRDLNGELNRAVAAIEEALHSHTKVSASNGPSSDPSKAATKAEIGPILRDVLKNYGNALAANARLVRNLLSDLCPPHTQPWQRNVLVLVVEAGYLGEMLARPNQPLNPWLISNWISQLENSRGTRPDFARWGVECWEEAVRA